MSETSTKVNKKKLQAELTRKKLLQTSKRLIIEKGFNNVSISNICEECSVAKGTFYVYFESKNDIVMELLDDLTDELLLSFKWDDNLSASELLLDFHTKYMETVPMQGIGFTREFLMIILELSIYKKIVKFRQQVVVEKILLHGIEKGEYAKDLSIEIYSNKYILLIYSLFIDWCFHDGEYDIVKEGRYWIKEYLLDVKQNRYERFME
jgi:TetR/AcrR family transcriptional regulator, fatty acid metabolism regulator protein